MFGMGGIVSCHQQSIEIAKKSEESKAEGRRATAGKLRSGDGGGDHPVRVILQLDSTVKRREAQRVQRPLELL